MQHAIRHAVRFLQRSPAFSVPAVVILALGIGANAAVFAVAWAVLLRPLPFLDQHALVVMWDRDDRRSPVWEVSYRNFADRRAQNGSFTDLAATGSTNWSLRLARAEGPTVLPFAAVSGSFFDVLGVRPLLGRSFVPADATPSSAPVVILSEGTWRALFGSDPQAIGRSAAINAGTGTQAFTIVGVMPAEVDYPRGAAAWIPLEPLLAGFSRQAGFDLLESRDFGVLYIVGRLKRGVDAAAARAEMDQIVARQGGSDSTGRRAVVTPIAEQLFGPVRPALRLLVAAALLVLTLACANVVGLLLARLAADRRRLAIQIAIGARRSHLLKQSFADAAALTACGAIAAAAVASWGVPLLVAMAPADVPRLADVTLRQPAVIAFLLAMVTATALVCGAAPLFVILRQRDVCVLRPAASGPASTLRARSTLVALQTAAAFVLLVAAGVTVQSFRDVRQIDPGFNAERLVTFNVSAPDDKYPKGAVNARFVRPALDAVRSLRGIRAAAAVSLRPFELGPIGADVAVLLEGQSPEDRGASRKNPTLNSEVVTPGFFEVMQIPVLEGRGFTEHDSADAPAVAVVGRSAARALWPGETAIGKRVLISDDAPGGWRTVVGVVGGVLYRGLQAPRLDIYTPYLQSDRAAGHFMVKAAGDPAVFLDALAPAIRAVDPGAAVDGIVPMHAVIARQTAPWRFAATLFSMLSALGLAIAIVGLYALVARQVAERTREIGIRVALGARRRQIVTVFLSRLAWVVGAGIAAGAAGGLLGTQALDSLAFGSRGTNLYSYAGVVLVLLGAAAAGTYWPLRRATAVDPLVALKEE